MMINISNENIPDIENEIDDSFHDEDHDIIDEEPAAEPEPEFDPEAAITSSNFRRRKLVLSTIIIGVIAILAISLGVSLSKKNNTQNENQQSNLSNSNNAKQTVIESTTDNVSTVSTRSEDNNKDVKAEPKQEGNNGKPVTISVDNIANFIDVSKGFMVNLQGFSEGVLSGYSTCSKLLSDVEEAAKFLSNAVIQNSNADSFMVMAAGGDYYSSGNEKDSYGTNNQHEGVDEADVVKSDGTNVYLAYGNDLVVLSKNGKVLSKTAMPQMDYSFPVIGYWNPDSFLEDNGDATAAFAARSSGMPPYYSPTQSIRSLLLNEGRLAVIVEGFQFSSSLIFLSGGMTGVYLYDINIDGTVSLVDKKTIRGLYRDARAIDNQAHVVTSSDINSSLFSSYLRHWMFPQGISDEEYRNKAFARAKTMVPQFAKQLIAELLGSTHDGSVDEYDCARIVRLSLMRNGVSSDDTPNLTNGNGILNSYTQTTSFDMNLSKFSLSQSVSGAFLPTSWLNMYSSKDMLILAAQGWKRTDTWNEYTYLMGFDISNGAAHPAAIGEVPGYLLNRYSLDHYNGHLRVATTTSESWGFTDGEWTQKSESISQLTILERSGNKLQITGQVNNIAAGERIYSTRFMKEKAFVVTFKQVDPFFTFDLSDPTNPTQQGELKISGFSNYLHPINNGEFVLAVGQDANATTGRPMGLQISLFDTTDFDDPQLAQKLIIQNQQNGMSTSAAQYDPHAFRYIGFFKKLILPVSKFSYSMNGENGDSFDGFRVYDIDENQGITEVGEIIHADSELISRSCFSWAYVPARSMVFNGNLMTMKGHTIKMTQNVKDPSTTLWTIDLDEGRTSTDVAGCMPWFS